jgi:hypothetical protein
VAHYNEPARVALIVNRDEEEAKKHYTRFFQAHYTIDNTKTENTHLELLSCLFSDNEAIANVARWFSVEREKICSLSQEESHSKGFESCSGGDTEKKQGIAMGK